MEEKTLSLMEVMGAMKPDAQKLATMVLEAFCNGVRARDALEQKDK